MSQFEAERECIVERIFQFIFCIKTSTVNNEKRILLTVIRWISRKSLGVSWHHVIFYIFHLLLLSLRSISDRNRLPLLSKMKRKSIPTTPSTAIETLVANYRNYCMTVSHRMPFYGSRSATVARVVTTYPTVHRAYLTNERHNTVIRRYPHPPVPQQFRSRQIAPLRPDSIYSCSPMATSHHCADLNFRGPWWVSFNLCAVFWTAKAQLIQLGFHSNLIEYVYTIKSPQSARTPFSRVSWLHSLACPSAPQPQCRG